MTPGIAGFAERMQEVRKRLGLSTYALARRCGITETGMRNYLAGRTLPNMENLDAISRATEVSLEWLVRGDQMEGVSDLVKQGEFWTVRLLTSEDNSAYDSGAFDLFMCQKWARWGYCDLFTVMSKREKGDTCLLQIQLYEDGSTLVMAHAPAFVRAIPAERRVDAAILLPSAWAWSGP